MRRSCRDPLLQTLSAIPDLRFEPHQAILLDRIRGCLRSQQEPEPDTLTFGQNEVSSYLCPPEKNIVRNWDVDPSWDSTTRYERGSLHPSLGYRRNRWPSKFEWDTQTGALQQVAHLSVQSSPNVNE